MSVSAVYGYKHLTDLHHKLHISAQFELSCFSYNQTLKPDLSKTMFFFAMFFNAYNILSIGSILKT